METERIKMHAEEQKRYFGVVGFFDSPGAILKGMHKVREANFRSIDAFTPFPVHGLEQAQGLKRSPIPWVTFFAAITGASCAFALQYWTSAVDWPIIVGGKPFNSWPAFVPVMFELTILFAGISTVVAMIFLNRLPNMQYRVADASLTRDRFAIIIDNSQEPDGEAAVGPGGRDFTQQDAEKVLRESGARDIRMVQQEGWFS